MRVRRRGSVAALAATLAAIGATVGVLLVAPAAGAAAAESVRLPSTGTITVHGRGNGHGHGLSQYGAEGAALAGLSTARILAFYYPNTTPATSPVKRIRVRISDATTDTTVLAGTGTLSVTGHGALPATGYDRFRLVPSGDGLAVQGRGSGSSKWTSVATGLPARADFSSSAHWVQLLLADGTSTRYRGTVGALRLGSGEITINRVSLDGYTEGVVPREMPASWKPAAVAAQAVAARTYGANAAQSSTHDPYDICDTTQCQVYGGMAHFSSGGQRLWTDDPAAIQGNQNEILTYKNAAIFAKFSASNGGATVSGGEPYLVGKVDPYDDKASGDPYLNWSRKVPVSSLAAYYGMAHVTSIRITRRDGNGAWGGRVVAATVYGTTSSGAKTSVPTTGYELASAMDVLTPLFHIDGSTSPAKPTTPTTKPTTTPATTPPTTAPSSPTTSPTPTGSSTPPGAPTKVRAAKRDAATTVRWQPPAKKASPAITGYRLTWGGNTLNVPASARSAFLAPVDVQNPPNVTVRAVSAAGAGQPATVRARAGTAPQPITALTPTRLFDTRSSGGPVSPSHPYAFTVAGKGGIPATGAHAVQLSLSILDASASGSLRVYNAATPNAVAAVVPYSAGQRTTVTVSVPLVTSSTIAFAPSAGSVSLLADALSWTGKGGATITPTAPTLVATVSPAGRFSSGGTVVSLAKTPGITAGTTAVVLLVQAWTTQPGIARLRIWPDGRKQRGILDAVASPLSVSANTVVVPLPASRVLHLSADDAGVGVHVTLLGTIGTGAGQLETFPESAIAGPSVSGHPALSIATSAATVPVAGIGQVPPTGASAVLLHATATAKTAGRVWIWPTGTPRPTAPTLLFGPDMPTTAATLVRLAGAGDVQIQSSVAGVTVTLAADGYVTN